MILVDTSIWADHIDKGMARLTRLLTGRMVWMHPFVLAELALGNLPNRVRTINDLSKLRSARVARHEEVMGLIEEFGLAGGGIGYVDTYLLAAAKLENLALWTRDRRLAAAAEKTGVVLAS